MTCQFFCPANNLFHNHPCSNWSPKLYHYLVCDNEHNPNYTQTVTASSSAVVSSYNGLKSYCPTTFNHAMYGWDITSLPDDGYDQLLKYCEPSMNATMPTSTQFPASCLPAYYGATSSSAVVTPTKSAAPTQSGIASNCGSLGFRSSFPAWYRSPLCHPFSSSIGMSGGWCGGSLAGVAVVSP